MTVRLRCLVAVVLVLSLGFLAGGVGVALQRRPDGARVVVAAMLFFVGEIALVKLRLGRDYFQFTWSGLAGVFSLVMLPPGWVVVVGTVAILVAQATQRRLWVKRLFNVGNIAVSTGLANVTAVALGYRFDRVELSSPRMWTALGAGALVSELWISVAAGMAIAYSQGLRARNVIGRGAVLYLPLWISNTVAGIALGTVARQSPIAIVVLPVLLGLSYLAYLAYVTAREDRDTWRTLQDTSRDLSRLRRVEIAEVVLLHASALFNADFADVMLVDEGGTRLTTWRWTGRAVEQVLGQTEDDIATFWPRVQAEHELYELRRGDVPHAQRRELDALGVEQCVVVPILSGGRCLGALRIGFTEALRIRTRTLHVLRTFSYQLSTSVENARLYEEMRAERARLSRIVDNMSDGILYVGADGRVASSNAAMSRISGRALEDIVGHVLDFGWVAVDGVPVTVAWLQDLMTTADGEPRSMSVISGGRDGSKIQHLHLSVAMVRSGSSQPEPSPFVIAVRDVTNLDAAADQMVSTDAAPVEGHASMIEIAAAAFAPDADPVAVDQVEFVLRRVPFASRSLHVRRRAGSPSVLFSDEYDLQDFVEAVLRTHFVDVRPEETTPSLAGGSGRIDFVLKRERVGIEIKVTRPGRNERAIRDEILVDVKIYERHPDVDALVVVVYDLASTFRNPDGFEDDLSEAGGSIDVRVCVVAWPVAPRA